VVGFNGDRNKKTTSEYSEIFMQTRDFIIAHHGGVFASPHYRTWGVDVEACGRALAVGKYIYAPEAHVSHIWLGNRPDADETYRYERPYWQSDTQKMERRRAAGWPNDFDAVIGDGIE
jgi:GT2 family glycosyltransferase